jgi:hypothetical protein
VGRRLTSEGRGPQAGCTHSAGEFPAVPVVTLPRNERQRTRSESQEGNCFLTVSELQGPGWWRGHPRTPQVQRPKMVTGWEPQE